MEGARQGVGRGHGPAGDADDTISSHHHWQLGEESGMDEQRITGRFGRRLLWCTLGAMLALSPGTASAAGSSTDACGQSITTGLSPDHDCQNQTQTAIPYNGSQTQGWA
jgi:hypothetical protein